MNGKIIVALGKKKKNILIADRHPLFRSGLKALFGGEENLHVVGDAANASDALARVRALTPDVLVMDIGLLNADGAHAPIEFRQLQPSLELLLLTPEDGPKQLETAIAAGASGYMLRISSPRQIVAAIQKLGVEERSGRGLSKTVPDLKALAESNKAEDDGPALTPREEEVVRLLAEGRTVREVAQELALSVKTVEAHKLNLMRKLDIHNRASLLEYASRKGLVGSQLAR